jgi:hypothetical protein
MNIEVQQDYSRYIHSERYTRSKTEVKHIFIYIIRMSKAYVSI